MSLVLPSHFAELTSYVRSNAITRYTFGSCENRRHDHPLKRLVKASSYFVKWKPALAKVLVSPEYRLDTLRMN
jgi:hypothetical protein